MIKFLALQVIMGHISIDKVPNNLKEKVLSYIEEYQRSSV